MNVGDLHDLLKSLSGFLAAHQGKSPATNFDAFCQALEPFHGQTLAQFTQLLRKAGDLPPTLAESKKPPKSPKSPPKPKTKLKTKVDTAAIQEAVAELEMLYYRATEPNLEYSEISVVVNRLASEFDKAGFSEVAKGFGIKGNLGKDETRRRIEGKITEQKGRRERGEWIASEYAEAKSSPVSSPLEKAPSIQGDPVQ